MAGIVIVGNLLCLNDLALPVSGGAWAFGGVKTFHTGGRSNNERISPFPPGELECQNQSREFGNS